MENTSRIRVELVPGVEGAFQLHGLLTDRECDEYIRISEEKGSYETATLNNPGKTTDLRMRTNYRLHWKVDAAQIQPLFERSKEYLPSDWKIIGLNEELRFYRYDVGEFFAKHYDACFWRNESEQSHLTFIIYLNDDFQEGETTFYHGGWKAIRAGTEKIIKVKPKKGSCLVFYHSGPLSPLHEGATPTAGRKYVLRSDVMYSVIH